MKQLRKRRGWLVSVAGVLALTALLGASGWAAAEVAGSGVLPGDNSRQTVLSLKHTGGWGAGVLAEFSVMRDGNFLWKAKKEIRTGVIPKEELAKLIASVVAAGPGPGAEDAGYVEFHWVDAEDQPGQRSYSHPSKDPCHRLLEEIKALTEKYARKGGAVMP